MSAHTVVIPTTGRDNLAAVVRAAGNGEGPAPAEIIVVDDRPGRGVDLRLPGVPVPVRVVRSGGRGPAAARNLGWRTARTPWIAFLDDDVRPALDWPARLAADLDGLDPHVAASKAVIVVPLPPHRRPTDDERDTAGLATAPWITADMAVRRSALAEIGGFDEHFPRAFREDADLALRLQRAGHLIVDGDRVTVHPPRDRGFFGSVRAQAGNADNELMRRRYGRRWRHLTGTASGRLGRHAAATAAAVTALVAAAARKPLPAAAAAGAWAALTAGFAAERIAPGPRTPGEITRMAVTSALIPPAAVAHRARGALRHRRAAAPPVALLFDRDDTIIVDVPYLRDPAGVRPVPGAARLLTGLRAAGTPVGVVSNQSGVARGLITHEQLAAVNAEVDRRLGPFGTWQICPHDAGDACDCRKPRPALVRRAAAALGVDVGRCVLIGDTGADVHAALAAGARGVLVPTARTLPEEIEHAGRHAAVAADLTDAVHLALAGAA